MTSSAYKHDAVRILKCDPAGPIVASERDVIQLIGEAMEHDAGMVELPAEVLSDDFFKLSTRVAGEILQKFVTYRLRVAIVGDISEFIAASTALRDFVVECNRGSQIWFVRDTAELHQRLEPAPRAG